MDIERSLIAKIIREEGALAKALDENLSVALFEGPSKKVWDWCLDHYRSFNASPGEQALSQAFPEFEISESTETVGYYISQLRKKFMYNTAMSSMKDAAKILKKGEDPTGAIEALRGAVRDIDDMTQPTADVDWTKDTLSRIAAYEQLKLAKGIDGVPTPFPTLNDVTLGMHPEELIFVVARQGVGKTWMLVLMAHYNWLFGSAPLLFSKEMSALQIARRLDAAHSSLPYQQFRTGKLESSAEIRWREDMSELRQSHALMIIGEEGGGVSHVAAKIERYRPDIVYIDGMYLMDDDRGSESNWMRITQVARDLKKLAKRSKIPIVVSLQFNRDASNTQGDVQNIAYADIAKEADLIFGLFQSEDQRLGNRMTLKLMKQREGERCEFELEWNMEDMIFQELETQDVHLDDLEDDPVAF